MWDRNRVPADDDTGYVDRCRKGSTDAFQVLVERHQKRMFNIAYRMTGDYDEACEVVQEAFLSAFRAIKGFRGDATFSTWLTAITINRAKNHLRETRTRLHHEAISIDDPGEAGFNGMAYDPPSRDASPDTRLEQKETQAKVQGCIGTLDEEYREVLVLRDIEGYSYEEIGRLLRIADGTVKSRLFRARSAVKDCLKKALGNL
jgi:RNA polymerase sigma-70 factor (ECF subfamily)